MNQIKFQIIKPFYRKLFPRLPFYLEKELEGCETILDLGSGASSPIITFSKRFYCVGVEIFEPYLLKSATKQIHNEYIKSDVRKLPIKDNSFDCVLALDILEHLDKKEGYNLIDNAERIARKKVIIFTPNGFLFQNAYDDNPWQAHKSGWSLKELRKLGYKVYGVNGWRFLRGYKAELKFEPKLIWQIISDLTQKITYHLPKFAFQLLAIKTLS